jgi:hypothetical protein
MPNHVISGRAASATRNDALAPLNPP